MSICPVEGCDRDVRWNGMCQMHAHRIAKYGDPHHVKYNRHGKDRRTYNGWLAMVNRCTNESDPSYHNYGGRGITVCDRWKEFDAFYADMGKKPANMTLERVDNDKGYSPENCKWVTKAEQQRNRRCNKLTIEDAREIRRRVKAGERQKDVAEDYPVSAAYICQIVRGRIWKEIKAEGV